MSKYHVRKGLALECILQAIDDERDAIFYDGAPILRTVEHIADRPDGHLELATMVAGLSYTTAYLVDGLARDFNIPREELDTRIRDLLIDNELEAILQDAEEEA